MALEKYKQKRNRKATPEPFGGKSSDSKSLHFVVQKHDARRLHYDFRLEMEGVLKSWAVPKGPSTNPDDRRLAMMVEDHPFDYRNFEGIIPEGEYGGGTVIVWDEGAYESADLPGKSKKEQEKALLKGINGGKVKIILHGQKLKGKFVLVKYKDKEDNSWFLMKMHDEESSSDDITKQDKSVRSGKTIEEVEKTSTNIYHSNRSKENAETGRDSKKPHELSEEAKNVLKKASVTGAPSAISPMLATLVDKPFNDDDWLFEIKWDGYRTIAVLDDGDVKLVSRNGKSFTEKYYPVTEALKEWKMNAVFDSELVVLNNKGASDFGALQNWRSEADGELIMYVFDLLWYEGKNLMLLPLKERRLVLEDIFPDGYPGIRLSEVFQAKGEDFFRAVEELGLEGMIAKNSQSTYSPGFRSKNWLKIKVHKRQEVVIGGYTLNEGTGKLFSALLLGVYENKKLRFAGKVGTGFNYKMQKEMMSLFKPLVIKKSPFDVEPDVNQPSRFRPDPPRAEAVWLKPELVGEITYTEMTSDGVFRHPSFKGLRTDKKAAGVVKETEARTEAVLEEVVPEETNEKNVEKEEGTINLKAPEAKTRKSLLNPTEETQVKNINGHDLKFTNLSKVYWPDEGYTKRDMINYYYKVAEYILPYLKDRPQSLNRFPNGINGKSFYQKNVKGKSPDWVITFPYTTSDGEHKEYLIGNDEATLLWMANLGCIEMNPWFSRVQAEDYPDFCIIDLDPDKNTFNQVVLAALETKKVLDQLGVPSYPKTSGSTGMHIYIPLGAKYTYEQSQMFGRIIANMVHQRIPEFTSVERMVKNRGGKMYIDFLQNRPEATVAGPYSLRPKPGATVSMPLHWDEVKENLKMTDFTLKNAIERLKKTGDIFKNVLGEGIDIEKILEMAEAVL
ncbi:MAG TPA: DNA ligase D [Bacteroidales bacterium]|nr:DNA ligase D [Bacteroidales bacterium]